MGIEFGVLKREELSDAVELSFRAYEYYEYFLNSFPDLGLRHKVIRSVLYGTWRAVMQKSHFLTVKIDGKIVGLAVLEDPHYKRPSDLQFLLHGWWNVYFSAGIKRVNAWVNMDESAGKPCHDYQHNGENIWYCSSLTVDPPYQGKGVGTQLVAFMEEYIREHGGKQLTLFTNSEKNLAFYKKNNFEVFDERDIAVRDGLKMRSWSVKKTL
jgi:ribosomal protein S18 acetylase RimI-like enzyme